MRGYNISGAVRYRILRELSIRDQHSTLVEGYKAESKSVGGL